LREFSTTIPRAEKQAIRAHRDAPGPRRDDGVDNRAGSAGGFVAADGSDGAATLTVEPRVGRAAARSHHCRAASAAIGGATR
jgi:hypothetical protein